MTHALALLLICTNLAIGQVDTSAGLGNAKTFARIGDWENGIRYLEQYILQHPEDAEARLLLAECYFNWPDKQTVGDRTEDKNKSRALNQLQVLTRLGDEGSRMLLKGLHSPSYNVFLACSEVLREKKDERRIDELIQVTKEDPARTHRVVLELTEIERGREKADERVVKFFMSLMDQPDIPRPWTKRAGEKPTQELLDTTKPFRPSLIEGLAALRIQEAVPSLERDLKRAVASLPTADRNSEQRRYALEEIRRLIDAIGALAPNDAEQEVRYVVSNVTEGDMNEIFKVFSLLMPGVNRDAVIALSKVAFERLKGDHLEAWPAVGHFVSGLAKGYSEMLLQPNNKRQLHELCGSPAEEVRMGVIDVLGTIRDEEALPILLPKLQGGSPRPGRPGGGTTRLMIGDSFQPSVGPGEPFFWLSREPLCAWQAVKSISGPRTTEFLLEKLQSDDMSWVYTAATLLPSLKDDRAIAPLKKRYSELSASQDDIVRQVVSRIAYAYESLSGRLITEPEEKK